MQNVWLMGGLSVLTSVSTTPQPVCLLCASKGRHEVNDASSMISLMEGKIVYVDNYSVILFNKVNVCFLHFLQDFDALYFEYKISHLFDRLEHNLLLIYLNICPLLMLSGASPLQSHHIVFKCAKNYRDSVPHNSTLACNCILAGLGLLQIIYRF